MRLTDTHYWKDLKAMEPAKVGDPVAAVTQNGKVVLEQPDPDRRPKLAPSHARSRGELERMLVDAIGRDLCERYATVFRAVQAILEAWYLDTRITAAWLDLKLRDTLSK
jgi:hypothetical protein